MLPFGGSLSTNEIEGPDKLDRINQVRRLLWEAHEILDELRKEAKGRVLDPRSEGDLADVYILWAERDINGVQAKMDCAVEHIEREASNAEDQDKGKG